MNSSQKTPAKYDVVLGHDWLVGMRGGERVLEILCGLFPKAPVLTLLHDPSVMSGCINNRRIETSALQKIPGAKKHYRFFLPIFPFIVRLVNTPSSRILLTTSHCAIKGLRPETGCRHICYCFTPMRYAWTFYREYFGPSPVKAVFAKPMLAALRSWDRKTSARVDRFVAISEHVRKRIRSFYGRDADIVYPPVDTERCTPAEKPEGTYDLIVSALVPYKKIDLAVRAYTRSGYPLKIAGCGGSSERLQSMAGPNIEFLGRLSDESVLELYRNCRLLVFPGEEDFGIVPVEAQSCGRPVVAFGRGGALETVKENVSGVFFSKQTVDSLLDAVDRCASQEWDPAAIRSNASRFDKANFIRGITAIVKEELDRSG